MDDLDELTRRAEREMAAALDEAEAQHRRDVAALVAEVRRLRARVAELEADAK